jgi:predicted amidohydrolase YtcJ
MCNFNLIISFSKQVFNFPMRKLFYSTLIGTLFNACSSPKEPAALIITNAVIWTANPNQPSASSMAIRDGKILAIGDNTDNYFGDNTEVLDADGHFITPGFIDTHVHFITGGQNLSSVQLRDANTKEEFITRIADFARTQEPGTWILGGDWDHQLWGGELPQKEWVDSVTRHNPIMLNRLDGHMALVNSLALEELGIDTATEIADGEIFKNEAGELLGILKEDAYYNQFAKLPDFTDAQNEAFAKAAMNYVASHGVTSVHDMNGFGDMATFERLNNKGELITRIYSNTPLPNWPALKDKIDTAGRGDEWLKIGGLKGFVDGSLGSHTAAFFDGYTDAPKEHGYFVNSREELYSWVSGADKAGLQVMVHAIGDSANNAILNIYEQVANENGPRDRRFRIEHAQHLLATDVPRFSSLGVLPIMQPYHAIDDGRWAVNTIGEERIKTTYAFKSLLDADAKLAFGSDWFVAPPVPLLGMYAAVTRRTLDGKNPDGWVPQQKITVEQALIAYTIAGAYASFEEGIKGSLEPGKLADFVILDQNLLKIDPVHIKDVNVLMTYVGGKKVFEQSSDFR